MGVLVHSQTPGLQVKFIMALLVSSCFVQKSIITRNVLIIRKQTPLFISIAHSIINIAGYSQNFLQEIHSFAVTCNEGPNAAEWAVTCENF